MSPSAKYFLASTFPAKVDVTFPKINLGPIEVDVTAKNSLNAVFLSPAVAPWKLV